MATQQQRQTVTSAGRFNQATAASQSKLTVNAKSVRKEQLSVVSSSQVRLCLNLFIFLVSLFLNIVTTLFFFLKRDAVKKNLVRATVFYVYHCDNMAESS